MVYAVYPGDGHLNDIDAMAEDDASCEDATPDSRFLGEHLVRLNAKALRGLLACTRSVSVQVVSSNERTC